MGRKTKNDGLALAAIPLQRIKSALLPYIRPLETTTKRRTQETQHLELLDERPRVQLLREVAPGLRVQIPVALRDGVRVDLAAGPAAVDVERLGARDVYHAVDDDVRHVHALRGELPGQRLAQGAHRELAGREVAEPRRAPDAGRGARDHQRRRVRSVGDGGEEEGDGALGEVEEAEPRNDKAPFCQEPPLPRNPIRTKLYLIS